MQIILGSASPYRGELLARLGLPFLQRAAQVDETPIAGEHPAALAQRLAAAKARAVGAGCCGAALAAAPPASPPPLPRALGRALETSSPDPGAEPDGLRRPPRPFA